MPLYLRIDVYGLVPHHISKHTAKRLRRPLELDHLSRELVDPARHAGITPEDLGLYLLDVVPETFDYGSVVVYDTVHDGVQDRLGSTAQVLGVGLQLLAYPAQVRCLAVTHAHYEVFSHKEVNFAELDPLLLVQVAGRLEHDKERIPVALQLGPLVGVRRILDRQPVQAKLPGDGGELLFRRPVEADPSHTTPVPDGLIGLLEGDRLGGPAAIHGDGGVHDHSRIIRPCLLLPVRLGARRSNVLLRALGVRGRKIHPAERSRLVRLPLTHRSISLFRHFGPAEKPYQRSTGTPPLPKRQTP